MTDTTPGADREQRERVARAIFHAEDAAADWEYFSDEFRAKYRRLADAALAAARPDDDTTAALERVRALCDQWEADAKRADDAEPVTSDGLTRMILSARYLRMNAADLRAALDPQ